MNDFLGKPVEIESGKIYAIEVDHEVTRDHALDIKRAFFEITGSRCIIFSGARLIRSTEAELREKIASEIEAKRLEVCTAEEPADCINWRCLGYVDSANIARGIK